MPRRRQIGLPNRKLTPEEIARYKANLEAERQRAADMPGGQDPVDSPAEIAAENQAQAAEEADNLTTEQADAMTQFLDDMDSASATDDQAEAAEAAPATARPLPLTPGEAYEQVHGITAEPEPEPEPEPDNIVYPDDPTPQELAQFQQATRPVPEPPSYQQHQALQAQAQQAQTATPSSPQNTSRSQAKVIKEAITTLEKARDNANPQGQAAIDKTIGALKDGKNVRVIDASDPDNLSKKDKKIALEALKGAQKSLGGKGNEKALASVNKAINKLENAKPVKNADALASKVDQKSAQTGQINQARVQQHQQAQQQQVQQQQTQQTQVQPSPPGR